MKRTRVVSWTLMAALAATAPVEGADVSDARLLAAETDTANWLTHGRTYREERYSPLDQVNEANVAELRLAWTFPTSSIRGLEAVPIVADGVMYTTAPWSVVFALDAKTGESLWTYDPKVKKEVFGPRACCDVVNRGVAVYDGKVYVGTLDGRLVALGAKDGKVVWETLTVDPERPHTITAAPRVYDGKVLIGNGGAEFGVRGYVSAYDAKTGKLAWRTFTVPGDPSKGFESKALEEAAKTWTGEWWTVGGGGTVWDSMSYDPDLGLVYFGTGNGIEWDRTKRSPKGGDNLYLASVLALDVKTGEQKWHYQNTPGDTWDFDSVQHLLLADLEIGGKTRKTLLQAHKNGFFYVLDRTNGKLISAEAFAEVTWAKGIDPKTGRPIEMPEARYEKEAALVKPSPFGAHNWMPMSWSPKTGLVYIPVNDVPALFESDPNYRYRDGASNLALLGKGFAGLNRTLVSGSLVAWDPVAQKEAWTVAYAHPWNGGTLATAGNLVFQGTADNRFVAYRATDGERLWQTTAGGTGIIAAPITYTIDGVQYVSVSAGSGGAFALFGGDATRATGAGPGGWVLTWALDSKLPPPPDPATEVVRGNELFHVRCAGCHGSSAVGNGIIPDLRHSALLTKDAFVTVTKNGLPGTGMGGFGRWLTDDEIRDIQAYVRQRAEDSKVGRE